MSHLPKTDAAVAQLRAADRLTERDWDEIDIAMRKVAITTAARLLQRVAQHGRVRERGQAIVSR